MSTKSSDIWNFFVKLPTADESARCKLCENKFSCKKSSTKGLWDHLKSMHLAEYEKFLQKNTSTSDEPQKKADEKIAALMLLNRVGPRAFGVEKVGGRGFRG
ncbi:unnamed protein product [Meloidogyne enterolobii]|uniref:Uncharacterized protein n=1 Tax=Meloidogyne enterolobii TaxID=390850 RepID=A0ACB1AW05_MELEN